MTAGAMVLSSKPRALFPLLILAALFLWHAIILISWLRRDERPPRWDQSVHLSTAWDYKEAIATLSPLKLLKVRPRPGHAAYPPLVHYTMAPLLLLADALNLTPEDTAICANLLSIAVLIAASYFLASVLWGAKNGIYAAFLASLLPPVLGYAREPLVDLSLAAWVTAAYACWLRSEEFSVRRWTIALGICAGAGMLSKWSFPFYTLPILFDATLLGWKTAGVVRKNILWGLAVAALLSIPWYMLNALTVFPRVMRSAGLGTAEGDPAILSLASLAWYPKMAIIQVHWLAFAVGIIAVIVLFVLRRPGRGQLAAWLLSSYAFWTLVSNKNDRYLLPFLIPLALAVAALPFRIPIAASIASLVISTWLTWGPARNAYAGPPQAGHWPLNEIVEKAAELRDPSFPLSIMTIAVNHDYMNGSNFAWIVQKTRNEEVVPRGKLKRLGEFSEFVLFKTGSVGPAYASGRQVEAREEALRPEGWFQRSFELIGRWPLPDDGEALLYHRRRAQAPGFSVRPEVALPEIFTGLSTQDVTSVPMEGYDSHFRVAGGSVSIKGLTLSDVEVRLEGFLGVRDDDGRPRVLRLDKAHIERAGITGAGLKSFLGVKARNLRDASVDFLEGNEFLLTGRLGPVPIELAGRIRYDSEEGSSETAATGGISVRLLRVKAARIPLPIFLLGGLREREIALRPTRGMPFFVTLSGLTTEPSESVSGTLRIK